MSYKTRCALAILPAFLAGACAVEKVDEAHVGVHYTDGPLEGKKVGDIIEPGGSMTVFNDHVYQLPARQVTYIAGNGDEADRGPLGLTARGGVHMEIELAVRFFLNIREDPLRKFFTEICQRNDCWEEDGWAAMLNETFGNPMRAVVNDLGLDYDPEQLRYDNEVKDEFAAAFARQFVDSQGRLIGRDDYFCGPGYDREDGDSCPALSVEVTAVRYQSDDLESVREERVLAREQESLAVQQEQTARAQQRVNEAQATPEWERIQQAEAMQACAGNPECALTVIVGANGLEPSVPVG